MEARELARRLNLISFTEIVFQIKKIVKCLKDSQKDDENLDEV